MNEEKYTQLLEDGELFSYINDLQQRINKVNNYCEKQKVKMYKNRNKIAMFNLIKIENILKGR